jgi:NTE family protein
MTNNARPPGLFDEESQIMNIQVQADFRTAERRLPFECVALVLQGGGALGAYQAGVYEALAEAKIEPDWVAGVSIGAINAAIIAGNEPADRVAKLRAFWQEITANPLLDWMEAAHVFTPKGELSRTLFNQLSATCSLLAGASGFFSLRPQASTRPGC